MVGGNSAVIALKNNLYKAYACELSFQIIIWFINLAWHGSFHSYSRVKISHFFQHEYNSILGYSTLSI